MDSSSTSASKRPHTLESKESKLQRRRERERTRRASETAAEREQRLRKRREREIEPGEKPRAKNRGRLGYRENARGKEKDWLQRLIKQDLVVADKTGCIKLTVWQEEVGKFETNHCYKLDQVVVRIFDGINFISYPKDGAAFAKIPDIGEVHTEYDESQFESHNDFHNAVVSGVSRIFKYRSCMKCRSKIEPTNNCYGRCRSCNMLQNLDRVKETFSAVLMITLEDGNSMEIQAFERELRAIAEIEEGTIEEENLLEGKPFSFKINQRDIITNVWH